MCGVDDSPPSFPPGERFRNAQFEWYHRGIGPNDFVLIPPILLAFFGTTRLTPVTLQNHVNRQRAGRRGFPKISDHTATNRPCGMQPHFAELNLSVQGNSTDGPLV
jgi:hypothetical protein